MNQELTISIADVLVKLQLEGLEGAEPEVLYQKYNPFFISDQNIQKSDPFIWDVKFKTHTPGALPRELQVTQEKDKKIFEFSHLKAEVNFAQRRVKAEIAGDRLRSLENLLRFFLSDFLAKEGGALFHAAALILDDYALLLPGKSGSGKTTISRLAGLDLVLSDEMPALVRRSDNHFSIYATPFWGELGKGKLASCRPLKGIFLFEGREKPFMKEVSKAKLLQTLLHTVVHYSQDLELQHALVGLCQDLTSKVPAYGLGFQLDEKFQTIAKRMRLALESKAFDCL